MWLYTVSLHQRRRSVVLRILWGLSERSVFDILHPPQMVRIFVHAKIFSIEGHNKCVVLFEDCFCQYGYVPASQFVL